MDTAKNDKLRSGLDDSLSNLMAVLPGADNEPGWDIQTGDEGWTVRQMLAHLASAETSMNGLIDRALAAARDGLPIGDPMAPSGGKFDLDYWNLRQVEKRAERPPSALRLELTETRAHTLRQLKSRTPEELAAPAWHPALGDTVVESIYKVMAIHMRDHTRTIKKALREGLHGRYWADVE
ncbi:MAG: maleylpyruvate isomerase N-terminal domain-containing protein [Chloroflexia bacterium]